MMISIRYRFIFIHIAKTGGTSLREALSRQTWRDPYRIPQALCSRISGLFGHRLGCKIPRHARAVAAREMLPRELFDRCFKFAFVRNPWDLQVSSYHHIRRERPRLMTAAGIRDFESFLRWKLDGSRPYHYIVDTSIQQQADYLVDLHGKT
ncbi:MAG: sulfotransferase family 2 domain-containing protein, partial [Desulfobacterales bacterium]